MPLKRAVLPLLDHVDPLAADVGGANTVVFRPDEGHRQPRPQRHGYNTDVAGMVDALAGAGLTAPRSAVILGAGATACSALAALRDTGLRTVTVAARDEARAAPLLAVAQRLGVRVQLRPLGSPGTLAATDLLISTLPAGAADIYSERTYAGDTARAVFDVVYAPWPTSLARAAAAAGAVVIGGFDLLLHQAGGQFELMTGQPGPARGHARGRAGRTGPPRRRRRPVLAPSRLSTQAPQDPAAVTAGSPLYIIGVPSPWLTRAPWFRLTCPRSSRYSRCAAVSPSAARRM